MKGRAILVLVAATLGVACQEASVREGTGQLTNLQEGALRVLVAPQGIATLYDVAHPDGFTISAAARPIASDDSTSVELGPLEQTMPVRRRTAVPRLGAVDVTTELRSTPFLVPLRIRAGNDVRICRYRLIATSVTASGVVAFVTTPSGQQFDILEPVTVEMEGVDVSAIGACDTPTKLIDAEATATAIVQYVEDSLAVSAGEALRTSPIDVLGLPRQSLQIGRVSRFDDRRGTLIIESETGQRPDAVALTPDGLSAVLDAAADARRAPCAPPVTLSAADDGETDPLDPSVVERFDADFALAVSVPWLNRTVQAASLAGFACRGLDDLRRADQNDALLPVDDVLLDEVGLQAVPVSSSVALNLHPGALPTLEADASAGTMRLDTDDLQIEVFGDAYGAWTRLASVVADVTFVLRASTPAVDVASFRVEAIEVRDPVLESAFLLTPPATEDVRRWTQRTLLLAVSDRLDLPLPLESATSLRVTNAQVRTRDVVFFLRFEEP